jgi:hypothetical protein
VPCDVYLGTRAFAACRGQNVLAAQATASLEESIDRWAGWLGEEAAPRRLNLWLSGSLCRPMLLQPVQGLKTADEWQRVAQAIVASHTGLTAPCEVWVERRRGPQARMAAAVERTVLQRLLDTMQHANRGRARATRIAPWWVEPLRASVAAAQKAPKALAVRDCDSLVVLAGQGSEFESAALYTPLLDDTAAQSTLARAWLSAGVDPSAAQVARLNLAERPAAVQAPEAALASLTEWSR